MGGLEEEVRFMSTRKFKQITDGYLHCIGEGEGGIEISDGEYAELMAIIVARPTPAEGYDYRLRADGTWEEYVPEPEPEPDPDAEIGSMEALEIITGGNGA